MADPFTRRRRPPLGNPLPPRLARRLSKPVADHRRLLERHDHVLEQERELGAAIEQARASDAEQAREAVAAGREVPPRTEIELLERLDELRREEAAIEQVAERSAAGLLKAAKPLARGTETKLIGEVTALEREAVEQLRTGLTTLATADELAGQAGWCYALSVATDAANEKPYGNASRQREATRLLKQVLPRIEQELADARKRRAQAVARYDADLATEHKRAARTPAA